MTRINVFLFFNSVKRVGLYTAGKNFCCRFAEKADFYDALFSLVSDLLLFTLCVDLNLLVSYFITAY